MGGIMGVSKKDLVFEKASRFGSFLLWESGSAICSNCKY